MLHQTLAQARNGKARNCACCGADMRGRHAWSKWGKYLLCKSCGMTGWNLREDGTCWNSADRAEEWAYQKAERRAKREFAAEYALLMVLG